MTDHATGPEQPDIQPEPSAPNARRYEQRPFCRRRSRLGVQAIVGLVVLTIALSGFCKNREFWRISWQQRTLFSPSPPGWL